MGNKTTGKEAFGIISSLAAGETRRLGTVDCRLSRTASITSKSTTNGSATFGVRVNVYFSPDGDNFDTVPYIYFDVNLTAGSSTQETHICDFPEHGMVGIEIENLDSTYAATGITLWVTEIKHPSGEQ